VRFVPPRHPPNLLQSGVPSTSDTAYSVGVMNSYGDSGYSWQPGPMKKTIGDWGKAERVDVFLLVMVPWFVFVISLLFAVILRLETILLGMTLMVLVIALPMALSTTGLLKGTGLGLAAFVLSILAAIGALINADYINEEYMNEYSFLADGASYTNVTTLAPASKFADATLLTFKRGAVVDSDRTVGFMSAGKVYCIAPIMHRAERGGSSMLEETLPDIQFWAVGEDCCGSRRSFNCDESSSPTAHAAVVVQGRTFAGHPHTYAQAARMSLATHQLVSAPDALLVRWVTDAAGYKSSLRIGGVLVGMMSSAVAFLFLGCLVAIVSTRPVGWWKVTLPL